MALSIFGRPFSRPARSGANSNTTSAAARSARALPAPTVFSNAAEAPTTARRRLPLTCKRSATGLSDMPALRLLVLFSGLGWLLGLVLGLVQCHRGADQRLEGLAVDFLALVDVDRASHVAFKAGVEQARGVLERGALGKGQLHDAFVGLPGADDSIVGPHRNAAPLPLLDHFTIGLLDETADMREHLASPVAQFLYPSVDQFRRRTFFRRLAHQVHSRAPAPRRV